MTTDSALNPICHNRLLDLVLARAQWLAIAVDRDTEHRTRIRRFEIDPGHAALRTATRSPVAMPTRHRIGTAVSGLRS